MRNVTVNREVKVWVEDTYQFPDEMSDKEIEKCITNDTAHDYFIERDTLKYVNDSYDTGRIEISIDPIETKK